ncbi:MAG: Acyl-CoA synthetase (AMP-forming)/AMP-acid ligase [Pseudonocardiales bacterium]|nr:Acyl-CoA synthetase (AMP-forming)/AMP-acid ligase [Pseudonocardiales bacterium]
MSQPLGADAPRNKVALVMGTSGQTMDFGTLERDSNDVARLLGSLGLEFGDHIAILFGNEPELFPVAWAAQRSGLYFTPINWHLTAEEAAYVVADCGAKVLIASAGRLELVRTIQAAIPELQVVIFGEADPGLDSAETRIAALGDAPLPEQWAGFAMFYSSGTTGRPKGILRPAVRLPVDAPNPIDVLMRDLYGLGPDSIYLSTGPLYHAAPFGWSTSVQRRGGTAVVMERFDALQTLELIERYRVTHVQFVPTMMTRLLRLDEADRNRFDLSSLQTVIHAAAPCPVDVKRRIIDWFGPIVWEYYAGSEGNGYFAINSRDWLEHPGSVGRSMLGETHILDDEGRELAPGEVGTIWFAGTAAFEYHNDPDKTAGAFNDRGWSTLGDVGHLDTEGYLYLSDRRVDLIISGGVNIYPQEVENALTQHESVFDAAVIGLRDEEMGQRVFAVVQAEPGVATGPELAEELIAFCQSHLARFKCPREIVFVDELPRLPSGKLLRRRVRDSFDPEPTT